MQKACAMQQRSKPFLKVTAGLAVGRLKVSWQMRRFMRSHGDFRWKTFMFRSAFGMEHKTGLSPFASRKESRSDCLTVGRVLLITPVIIHCPFVICARFLPI